MEPCPLRWAQMEWKARLSRLLNTMEERGYIERRPNPEDGRGVLIFLT